MGGNVRRAIEHFMWGYQPHFRLGLESRGGRILKEMGTTLVPDALLVGIRVSDVEDGYAVCVEPEDGKWDLAVFDACHARAQEIYENHPDQQILYGDEPSNRDKPERIRRKSARQAVEEALAAYDEREATRSFCGMPARVGDYYVVPVLQVSADAFDALPALPKAFQFMEWISLTGMGEAAIREVLNEATEALETREPGRHLDEFSTDPPALLREAARRMCDAVSLFLEDFMLQGVFDSMNAVSSLKYEGGGTRGQVVFAPGGSAALGHQVDFVKAVPFRSSRLVRKVIEISGRELACICSGADGITGLAIIEYSPGAPVFRVAFTGHYSWELHFNDTLLFRSAFGVPEIPRPRLTDDEFRANARRVITGMTEEQGYRLWKVVEAAMDQRHGTMLVVSAAAGAEAVRLGSQSLVVDPMPLTPVQVRRLSGIDGAILVDEECVCHAVGVILDGLASDTGDPARGARYNSAIRYASTAKGPTLCIVVSEDGYVDMIPTLRPQVSRREVSTQIDALRRSTLEDYHAPRNWLTEHRFYLSSEECEVVNEQLARLYPMVMGAAEIWVQVAPFRPDPAMNDSYFLDE